MAISGGIYPGQSDAFAEGDCHAVFFLFTDNPSADLALRGAHMPDHLVLLETHADVISAVGPLTTEAGAGMAGLWVVETEDIAEAEALVRADPFWPTGLRH